MDKAPFIWYGGKSQAAPLVWQLLGDVDHYCEPFAGSLAVLLQRPHECNSWGVPRNRRTHIDGRRG